MCNIVFSILYIIFNLSIYFVQSGVLNVVSVVYIASMDLSMMRESTTTNVM